MTNRLLFSVATILIVLGIYYPGTSSFAQTKDTIKIQQSRKLDSVIIRTPFKRSATENKRFGIGTKLVAVPQESLAKMQMSSLADFIQKENAAYLKEYGRGMGAYISVRGTSASHTTIAWNGQSLSVPTMGQTDLSHIPLYFFDAMDIHIGGSSALYGDGSIGGSIQLKTKPKWERGAHGDVLISAGSFGTLFTGGTIRLSNNKIESRSSVLYSIARNNYRFENNTKPGRPEEYLNNAAYNNYGVLQELFGKIKNGGILSFSLLYLDFDRQIQPSVSLNDRPESYASIYDRNFKTSVGYNNSAKSFSYGVTASYSYDHQRYKEDVIAAHTFIASAEGEYKTEKFTLKGGLSGTYIKPVVHSYADSVYEERGNVYLLAKYTPFVPVTISAGLRYTLITNSTLPLMPSLDLRVMLLNRSGHTLSVRASVSRSSKVPTLNDRYWGGEHLYLQSEKSLTAEGGFDYGWIKDSWSAEGFVTLYRSEVDDWIRWLPAGQVWRPQNIPEVLSHGAEAGLKVTKEISDFKISLNTNYSFTNIVTVTPIWPEDPAKGEQLAYQPKHSLRASLRADLNKWSLYGGIYYTGTRTTLDIYDILPSYILADLGLIYKFSLFGENFTANGVVKNISNASYQNVKFYAMPGRNWQISLQWKF
jgi:iron complex outermembrane receptor protein